jgi:hypothetical protein
LLKLSILEDFHPNFWIFTTLLWLIHSGAVKTGLYFCFSQRLRPSKNWPGITQEVMQSA